MTGPCDHPGQVVHPETHFTCEARSSDVKTSPPESPLREGFSRRWRNGRRAGFRCRCPQGREGSSPFLRTSERSGRFGSRLTAPGSWSALSLGRPARTSGSDLLLGPSSLESAAIRCRHEPHPSLLVDRWRPRPRCRGRFAGARGEANRPRPAAGRRDLVLPVLFGQLGQRSDGEGQSSRRAGLGDGQRRAGEPWFDLVLPPAALGPAPARGIAGPWNSGPYDTQPVD